MFENLESRLLLSAVVKDDVLVVHGTNHDDAILIRETRSQFIVRINRSVFSFERWLIRDIWVRGRGGPDRISAAETTVGCYIRGGLGNDTIYGSQGDDRLYGDEGRDELRGLAGDDSLNGGPAIDSLYGGEGNDTFSSQKIDILVGGPGRDWYDVRGRVNKGLEGPIPVATWTTAFINFIDAGWFVLDPSEILDGTSGSDSSTDLVGSVTAGETR